MVKQASWLAVVLAASFGTNAHALTSLGNVTASGVGSCKEITGTFPALASVATNGNGQVTYSISLLITPTGETQQYILDVLRPDNTLSTYDTVLLASAGGITNGTWSGSISISQFNVIVVGSTGTSSGTPIVLDTPVPGAADCKINIFGLLFFAG